MGWHPPLFTESPQIDLKNHQQGLIWRFCCKMSPISKRKSFFFVRTPFHQKFSHRLFQPLRYHRHVNCETALHICLWQHVNTVDINADTDADDIATDTQVDSHSISYTYNICTYNTCNICTYYRSGVIDDRVDVSVLC